jgi:hypothetical protein
MVGDSRRSRRIENWRNVKKQFKYKRLEEESDSEENLNKIDNKTELQKEYLKKINVKNNISGKGINWMKSPNMSNSVRSYINFLATVSKKPSKKRQAILREFKNDKNLFDALSEISHNAIKGNIKLSELQKKKLRKHQRILRALDCPKTRKCATKRKRILEQSGGFLPILIPAAVAALGHLSGALINKIIK